MTSDIFVRNQKQLYILIIVLLWLFIYVFILYFLKFILSIFEDHIGNKCAIVCFNVSILGKYYIYMYYNVLPNKLTSLHSQCWIYEAPIVMLNVKYISDYAICHGGWLYLAKCPGTARKWKTHTMTPQVKTSRHVTTTTDHHNKMNKIKCL